MRLHALKSYPETEESAQFGRATLIDMDGRLRVAREITKNETQASTKVFRTLKRRGHPDGPPPLISDGWDGIEEAMIEAYGCRLEYRGRGRPPTCKKPGEGWMYVQIVKQRDERERFQGTTLRKEWFQHLKGRLSMKLRRRNMSPTSKVG